MPQSGFSPHAKKVLRTCWYEVFLWQENFVGAELEIYLVEDSEMRKINAQYRNLDKVTDVVSLDFGCDPLGHKLGVVYLASGVINRVAKKLNHSREAEIVFLTVHGMLHIWGYDHEKKADENRMLRAMKIVLENFPQYTPLLATYKRRSSIDY